MIAIVVPILTVSSAPAISIPAGGVSIPKGIIKQPQPFPPNAKSCFYLSYSRCHSRSLCLLILALTADRP